MNDSTILNFFKSINEYFISPNKSADEELKRLKITINESEIDKEIKTLIDKENGFDRVKELVTYE